MADVLFVVITVVFFALAAGFVRACEQVIGPADDGAGVTTPEAEHLTGSNR